MEDIKELFGSLDNHTRKSVQMHSLARYYAMHLEKETLSLLDYGKKSCQQIQEKWKTRLYENGFITMATKKLNKFLHFSHSTMV